MCIVVDRSFFFFQAEDGIRDIGVTGVQTCALPIFCSPAALMKSILLYSSVSFNEHWIMSASELPFIYSVTNNLFPRMTDSIVGVLNPSLRMYRSALYSLPNLNNGSTLNLLPWEVHTFNAAHFTPLVFAYCFTTIVL